MNKKELIEYLERKDDEAWIEFETYCLKNNNRRLDEKADSKASELYGRWLMLEDLIDELDA